MVITPQEFPKQPTAFRSWKLWMSLLIAVALTILGGAWWLDLVPIPGLSRPPSQVETPGLEPLSPPSLAILEDPAFQALRDFSALPVPTTTPSRRANPFAPF